MPATLMFWPMLGMVCLTAAAWVITSTSLVWLLWLHLAAALLLVRA